MAYPVLAGISTAASSALTQSSGAVVTIPAKAGVTALLSGLRIFNGPAWLGLTAYISIAGLQGGVTNLIQLDHGVLLAPYLNFQFDMANLGGLPASGVNVPIVLTLAAITGDGQTAFYVYYDYR